MVPDLRTAEIVVRDVTVCYPDRAAPRPAPPGPRRIVPGVVTALAGPERCGQVDAARPAHGLRRSGRRARCCSATPDGSEVALADLDPDAWRAQVAYLPQAPYLGAGIGGRRRPPRCAGRQRRRRTACAGVGRPRPGTTPRCPGRCPTAWRPWSARVGRGCRPGRSVASRWPGRCAATPPWCSSTSRPRPWTARLRKPSSTLVGALRRAGRTVVLVAHRPALLRRRRRGRGRCAAHGSVDEPSPVEEAVALADVGAVRAGVDGASMTALLLDGRPTRRSPLRRVLAIAAPRPR